MLVRNLVKVYNNNLKTFKAINNLSFGLEYGECFALLGVNGAGKTTTFKSLTADVTPSSGEIFINGLNVGNPAELRQATKLIGYCPQFDAIFEGMTVLEHIEFYARIKGVIPSVRTSIINKLITEMDLEEFRNVQV